jgi:hypothetical protein
MVYIYNLSTQEAEAGGSQVQGYPGLPSVPCLKKHRRRRTTSGGGRGGGGRKVNLRSESVPLGKFLQSLAEGVGIL